MLIRFNVNNFLSFDKMQEFSMIGGKAERKQDHLERDDHLNLLKFTAIYGANAAGKSNLINAIDFAQEMILTGFPEGHTAKFCKVFEENKSKTSNFEFEIKIGSKYYAYGFELLLNQSSIVGEWLYEILPSGNDIEIFKREQSTKTCSHMGKSIFINPKYFTDQGVFDRVSIYAEDVKDLDNVLFLSEMNRNKDSLYTHHDGYSIFNDIYSWFSRQLDVNFPDKSFSDSSYILANAGSEKIFEAISAFGMGITKINLVETSLDRMVRTLSKEVVSAMIRDLEKEHAAMKKSGAVSQNKSILLRDKREFYMIEMDENDSIQTKMIELEHENISAVFNLSEESDGTRRLLDLMEILFAENSNKVYFIDEIDRCLHPQLTYKFIESYIEGSKANVSQLIVTTHESILMDFELLRRDEIWFVDKAGEGYSTVYSLEEYNDRFDKKIDRAYFEGRYGGVPIFGSVFPVKEDNE